MDEVHPVTREDFGEDAIFEALGGYDPKALAHLPTYMRERLNDRLLQYDAAFLSAREHFMVKNMQYGDSVGQTGVLGAVVEFVGITARLRQLVIKSRSHGLVNRSKVGEILRDAVNYTLIALMMANMNNWDGE